jgi:hypothetical protein
LEEVDQVHIQIETQTRQRQVEAQVEQQLVNTCFWHQPLTLLLSVQGVQVQGLALQQQRQQVMQGVILLLL